MRNIREKRPEKIAEMLRIHSSGFCHSREQQCSYFGDDHCGQHLAEDAAEAIETLLAERPAQSRTEDKL